IMSDHEDAQDYTANGPGFFGFKTGGVNVATGDANVDVGADLMGIQFGVRGVATDLSGGGGPLFIAGVPGESKVGWGVRGICTGAVAGVQGEAGFGSGVKGESSLGWGVEGKGSIGVYGTVSGAAVQAIKDNGGSLYNIGVYGLADDGPGVLGESK